MGQVTADDFSFQMDRLCNAFGSPGGTVRAAKVNEWFDIWQRFYGETSPTILALMVDRAVKDYDRLPSFAQFKAMREVVLSGVPRQGTSKQPCSVCEDGTGLIRAQREELGFGVIEYSFRCHCCENWKGLYDGLPGWTGQHGYEIIPTIVFDVTNQKQLKGLAVIRESAPKLYAKIAAKYPEMAEASMSTHADPIFRGVPGPIMNEETKDQLRRQSLQREAAIEEETPF